MTDPILFDVDGVLADFSNHLLRSVGSSLTLADVDRWDIFSLVSPVQATLAKALCADPEWWAAMPPMEGAIEAVGAVRRAGASIVFLSSPWVSCAGWEHVRRGWLERHFGARHDSFIAAASSAKALVRGAALVEDKPEMIDAWTRAHPGRPAFLFDAPYNREAAHIDWSRLRRWDAESVALVVACARRAA